MASSEAARPPGSSAPMSRRQVPAVYRFFSPHRAAVLDAAIGRLMPSAHESRPVDYVDRLLWRFGAQTDAHPVRVADVRDLYANGIALLDRLAGGDFTAAPPARQDFVLAHTEAAPFTGLLFEHIVEAIYAPPQGPGRRVGPRHVNGCDDTPTSLAMA